MHPHAVEIYHARKKIKHAEESREMLKQRLRLLQQRCTEIRQLITDGCESNNLARGLVSVQEEIRQTQSSLNLLKIEIKTQSAVAHNFEQSLLEDVRKNGNLMQQIDMPTVFVKKDLHKLEEKYQGFASDHTRVNSMRLMASRFAEEIRDVINRLEA